MEENEYYTDPITLTAETGEGAQSSPRERILANFRVLARTNLVLRGAATERER
jgi:hypothetical protein